MGKFRLQGQAFRFKDFMGILRDLLPNNYYHIINRGNNSQDIFLHKKDYLRFLYYLEKYSGKFLTTILAYCLMPTHIHLLLKEGTETSISEFMHALNTAYTMYFNLRHSRSGHVFEGPFRDVLVKTDEYLVHVSRYIHLNPSSAGIVKKPQDYHWSSYRHYLELAKMVFIDEEPILSYFSKKDPVRDYREFVESRIDYQREINLQKLFLESKLDSKAWP